jgi:hypothetical protein
MAACLSFVVKQNEYGLLAVVMLVPTGEPHLDALLKNRVTRDENTFVGAPAR